MSVSKEPFDDLAPTPVEELLPDVMEEENKDDEEGEDGEGDQGKKGGTGGKKPSVNVPLAEEENLEEYDSEKLIEKLKMLVWAPFSTLVPGASSFESENDLKRKLFLGQVGLMTNQIDPHDIADPNLIERLEQRNQERQQKYGLNIDAQAAGSAAAIGGAVAALQEAQPNEQKKQDPKLQIQQPREASLDARKEFEEDPEELKKKVEQKVELAPEAEENSFAAEKDRNDKVEATRPAKQDGFATELLVEVLTQDYTAPEATSSQSTGLEALSAISSVFNSIAQQTEYNEPQQKIDFRFADPAPKLDVGGSMGGV